MDEVVLDLRYEAREIDQNLTSQAKIDQWFELKTKGLTDLAKAQLKQRWGTMQKVLSSRSRLDKHRGRHPDGHGEVRPAESGRGNAMLVSGSIYEACKFFELFDKHRPARQVRHRDFLCAQHRETSRARNPARVKRTSCGSMRSTRRCWPIGSMKPRRRL
jgi:hypothetical protein